MIKYNLICKNCNKSFDSWFASSKEYEKLKKLKHISCYNCNSLKVEKSLMTPNVLNAQKKDTLVISGKQRVHQTFLEAGIVFEDAVKQLGTTTFKRRFQLAKLDDIYMYVEQGDISVRELLRYISKQLPSKPPLPSKTPTKKTKSSSGGILVSGEKETKSVLAKCCRPIPGDDIVGIVVMGKGVSIHRHDCLNLSTVRKKSPERLVDVQWDTSTVNMGTYTCTFRIEGYDRAGLLHDLLNIIYAAKLNLKEVKTRVNKDNTSMSAVISVDLSASKDYYTLKHQLMALEDVYTVTRMSLGLES